MKSITKYIPLVLTLVLFSCIQEIDDKNISVIETGINSDTWIKIPAGKFYKGMHNHETHIEHEYEIMITDVTNNNLRCI